MSAAHDSDVQQVIENELRLMDRAVRRSRPAAAALLDRGFREFGSSGRAWDYESILDLTNRDDSVSPTVDEVRADRLGPDVILLTYRTRTPTRTARRSSVWRRQDGGSWRIYFHQGTPVSAAR